MNYHVMIWIERQQGWKHISRIPLFFCFYYMYMYIISAVLILLEINVRGTNGALVHV